jgi:hypothetical protein
LSLVEDFQRLFVETLFERELIFLVSSWSDFSRRDVEVPTLICFYFANYR